MTRRSSNVVSSMIIMVMVAMMMMVIMTTTMYGGHGGVDADIDVHCLHKQVKGTWRFFLLGNNANTNVDNGNNGNNAHADAGKTFIRGNVDNLPLRTHTHRMQCDSVKSVDALTMARAHRVVDIRLDAPNKARVVRDTLKRKKDRKGVKKQRGSWTMIYDQGFEINLLLSSSSAVKKKNNNNKGKDNKAMSLFAFSRYVKHNDNFSRNNGTQQVSAQEVLLNKVTSYCNETQVGWYHDVLLGEHGCMVGIKLDSTPDDVLVHTPVNTVLGSVTEAQMKKWKNERELVDLINRGGSADPSSATEEVMWTASAYDFFEAMDHSEVSAMMGSGSRSEEIVAQQQQSAQELLSSVLSDSESASYSDGVKCPHRNKNHKLPKKFDWRNVNGVDFTSPVRSQGSCGSCYIFATLGAIESRVRILTNNTEKVVLSPQDVVSCGMYSQKCRGGFPYLTQKYIQDYTVVDEECMPYAASDSVPCASKCATPKYAVRVKHYSYIGGFYGASHEQSMMHEIYHHGPIPVNYVVYPDFKYYKTGIYHSLRGIAGKKVKGKKVNPWEPVNHSVVIVGWGTEKRKHPHAKNKTVEVPYWIVRNSWGEGWGEAGHFRIRRGTDEVSIESTVTAPHPVLLKP